jgi:DNA-binding IscR family transcriptional regulator
LLTKKGKYGLKAMVYLAGLAPAEIAQVTEIADANVLSRVFPENRFTLFPDALYIAQW